MIELSDLQEERHGDGVVVAEDGPDARVEARQLAQQALLRRDDAAAKQTREAGVAGTRRAEGDGDQGRLILGPHN